MISYIILMRQHVNEKYTSRKLRGFQSAHDALMKIKEERYVRNIKGGKEKEEKEETKTPIAATTDKMEGSTL